MTTDATANRFPDDNLEEDFGETPTEGAEGTQGAEDKNDVTLTLVPVDGASAPAQPLEPTAEQLATWSAQFDESVARSTARDTWNWAWKDTAMRVLPFVAASGAYAKLSGQGAEGIGLTSEGWRRDLLLGIAIGVPLAGVATIFREKVSPGYHLPTEADQVAQTFFYFAINAPGEELFWRGTVQDMAVRGLRRLPRLRKVAGVVGWAATTAVFGAYHRLGKWSWRSIAGVTVAGALFGALYQWPRGKRSILTGTIAHGFATAGFLSWADFYQYRRQKRHYLALMRARYIDQQ